VVVHVRTWFVVAVATACGRVGFDTRVLLANGDDAATVDGAMVRPIGWWKLDEGSGMTVADSVGTATGTFVGSPIDWVPGRAGGWALSFHANGADVDLGAPAAFANLSALTVSAWIQPSSVTADGNAHCVFDKGTTTAGWAFQIAYPTSGCVEFNANGLGANTIHRESTSALVVGQWAHVVATWDGSNLATNVHLYVNGVETTYSAMGDAAGARADDSAIGASLSCNGGPGLDGALADVRLYDRALDAGQVSQL
jgi:hypothetical protein